jgi:NAD(P)-dependent dehydrogenase (short-subunit alcohol dehydrogenase family)
MSDDTQAQSRIHAIGRQLSSTASASDPSSQSLPPIATRAPASSAPRVQDKVVIITGANSALGIGRATAHRYAESGARAIFLCDIQDSNLDAHRREITAAFPKVDVHARRMDAASDDEVKSVVDDAMKRYGRLDVFFANAGMTGAPLHFTDCTDDEFMKVIKVNTLR